MKRIKTTRLLMSRTDTNDTYASYFTHIHTPTSCSGKDKKFDDVFVHCIKQQQAQPQHYKI